MGRPYPHLLNGRCIWSDRAIDGLREAVYFSTITYGAIGYSDAAMAEQWRLVSAIEGINGIILIGWSTAFFVTLMGRLRHS